MYNASKTVKSIGNLLSISKEKDSKERESASSSSSSSSSTAAAAAAPGASSTSEKASPSPLRPFALDKSLSHSATFFADIVQSTQTAAANLNTMVNTMNSNLNATFSKSQRTANGSANGSAGGEREKESESPSFASPAKQRLSPEREPGAFFHKDTDFFENDGHDKVVEVVENERFDVDSCQWGAQFLLPSDPKRFKSAQMQSDEFREPALPDHWSYTDTWEVDTHGNFTEGGWMYGEDFLELDLHHYLPRCARTTVRRKRWIRRVIVNNSHNINTNNNSGNAQEKASNSESVKIASSAATATAILFPRLNTCSSFADTGSDRCTDDFDFEYEEDRDGDESSTPQLSPAIAASSANANTNTNGGDAGDLSATDVNGNASTDTANNPTVSTAASAAPAPAPAPAPPRRRSYFSFGGGGSAQRESESTAPPAAPSPSPHTAQTSKHVSDAALKIQSTTLSAIGKQIKIVEQECRREDDLQQKNWKDVVKPKLEADIAEHEKKLTALRKRMEKEVSLGAEHLNKLEEEVLSLSERLDAMKREYHFPFAPITFGGNGVYLAMDDFWLEYASGSFALDLLPDRASPRIVVKLRGTTPSSSSSSSSSGAESDAAPSSSSAAGANGSHAVNPGVNARLQIEKFQLAGDKGRSVPRLRFDLIKLTIAFSVSISLQYDAKTSKWTTDTKNFQIHIHSFRGPYGLNKSIVSMILSLVNPTLRKLVMQNLPFELGLLIRTLPSPFSLRGAFDLRGVDLNLMSQEWHKSATLAKLTALSATQLEMFLFLQRSMEREKTMKTAGELMTYIKQYSKNRGIWMQLVNLWSQAMNLYCEKVTLAKNEGKYAVSTSGENITLSLPEYTVRFDTFLSTCENLNDKRVKLKFALHHVDGQVSINHLLSFIFQIVYRIANDLADNANTVKRVQLTNMIEQIKRRYEEAVLDLQLVSKNIDFGQLAIALSLRSGAEGVLSVALRDILAQAPLLMKLNILADKNMGAIPLVPYIISFKPQSNGDISLEIYHFTHDAAHESLLLENLQTHTQEFLASSLPAELLLAQKERARRESIVRTRKDHEEREKSFAMEKNMLSYTNYENNIRAGCYSTSYNKTVDNITSGRVRPRSVSNVDVNASVNTMTPNAESLSVSSSSSQATAQCVASSPSMPSPLSASFAALHTSATVEEREDEQIQHLLVRQEKLRKSLESVLNDHPQGESADTLLSVLVKSPHISMIVDQPATLKPGAELFTVLLGHPKPDWKPFGTENRLDEEEELFEQFNQSRASMIASRSLGKDGSKSEAEAGGEAQPTITIGGVPVRVQTAPGIKLLAQIPFVDAFINLPSLLRFMLAHFADLLLLKSYLQILVGGEFAEEHLLAVKMILEKLSKYLLVPGLNIDININGKMVAMNGEIVVRLETPDKRKESGAEVDEEARRSAQENSAVVVEAQLSLREIFEDSKDIESILKTAMTGGV